jgi:hypothetical protein
MLLGGVAVAWPLAAHGQSTTQPAPATTANLPQIEVVYVKRIDPDAPKPRFQLRDGVIDLTKGFSLGGSEGIGATWKMPPTGETFDARYGRW